MSYSRSSDAGPEHIGVPVLPLCQNCRKPSPELVYIPGFDYMGCGECALEALATDAAEDSEWHCQLRLLVVQKATTVYGVVELLAVHNLECALCGGVRKPVAVESGGPVALPEVA